MSRGLVAEESVSGAAADLGNCDDGLYAGHDLIALPLGDTGFRYVKQSGEVAVARETSRETCLTDAGS
jgi:hypothetical protein